MSKIIHNGSIRVCIEGRPVKTGEVVSVDDVGQEAFDYLLSLGCFDPVDSTSSEPMAYVAADGEES